MKVLLAHVPYQTRGGEDVHVERLAEAYRWIGHEVEFVPATRTPPSKLARGAWDSLLGDGGAYRLERRTSAELPQLIHIHNLYPLLGPQFLEWVQASGIPAIMTVHNHRFYCSNGLALRDNQSCRLCLDTGWAWRPTLYNCNGDRKKSLYYTLALTRTRRSRLMERAVQRYLAPSQYIRRELERYGIAAEQIIDLPHPVFAPAPVGAELEQWDAIYVGRLSEEKGIQTLLAALPGLHGLRVAIAGDGPLRSSVESAARSGQLTYLGQVAHADVPALIRKARVSVAPSICNEALGLFPIESFLQARHCVLAKTEAFAAFQSSDYSAFFFEPGNPVDLAEALTGALAAPPVPREQVDALRERYSFDRFCARLSEVTETVRTGHPRSTQQC